MFPSRFSLYSDFVVHRKDSKQMLFIEKPYRRTWAFQLVSIFLYKATVESSGFRQPFAFITLKTLKIVSYFQNQSVYILSHFP